MTPLFFGSSLLFRARVRAHLWGKFSDAQKYPYRDSVRHAFFLARIGEVRFQRFSQLPELLADCIGRR
jgi:hypothetical protein